MHNIVLQRNSGYFLCAMLIQSIMSFVKSLLFYYNYINSENSVKHGVKLGFGIAGCMD